jgi:ketosteroid isomerase-like protein
MSEENVEIVRRVFVTFNRDGPAAAIATGHWAPDVLWDGTRSGVAGLGVLHGVDEVLEFFENDWFAVFPFEDWEIQMDEPVIKGDQVIVASHQIARGAISGAPAALTLGNIFTLRNGKIVRVDVFQREEDALAAAGLSE